MSTAEATRDVPAENERAGPPRASRSRLPPSSPGLAAGWLLRAAAFTAVAAGVTGLILAPGVRGNASEAVVVAADRAAAALAYFLVGLLVTLVAWGSTELVLRAHSIGVPSRIALVVSGTAVVFLSGPGLFDRLLPGLAVLVAAAAIVAVIAGAFVSARAPHTRAMSRGALRAGLRGDRASGGLGACQAASERASVQLYDVSRALATAGVMFEAVGQLVAVTWLGTRSKLAGQVGSHGRARRAPSCSPGVSPRAFTRTPRRGKRCCTPPWRTRPASLRPSVWMRWPPSSCPPRCCSPACPPRNRGKSWRWWRRSRWRLVSRGSFDAPLRALCAVAAAQWAALAGTDERAMWRTLLDDRARRLADDEVGESPPPPRG